MANEGSTKPTGISQAIEGSRNYWKRRAETAESELARVRGLLQRGAVLLDDLWRTDSERKQVDAWLADAQLVPSDAESVDIGKLDAADKSGKVNGVEEKGDV